MLMDGYEEGNKRVRYNHDQGTLEKTLIYLWGRVAGLESGESGGCVGDAGEDAREERDETEHVIAWRNGTSH